MSTNNIQISPSREQLETLLTLNFKRAWRERKIGLMEEVRENALEEGVEFTLDELEKMDWSDAQQDFLNDYFDGLYDVLKEKGLVI